MIARLDVISMSLVFLFAKGFFSLTFPPFFRYVLPQIEFESFHFFRLDSTLNAGIVMWLMDRISSAVLFAFVIFYTAAGWGLETWAKKAPGPGFMPRLLALALGALAILIWVQAKPSLESQQEVESYSKREPFIIFLLVLAYVFVMPQLGFPLSNFLLVVALRRMVEPGSWRADLAGAIGTVAIIHLVFVQILALQFPVFPVWWGE